MGLESIDPQGRLRHHQFTIRGNGDLFLSREGVSFKQWVTKKKIFITLGKIFKIEIKWWHNYKLKWPAKVLRIHFKEEGTNKIIGFAMGKKEAEEWKEKIEKTILEE